MASTKNFSTASERLESGQDLVLIDAECLLCNRLARFVIRRDPEGHFRFAALNSPAAERELAAHQLPPPPPGTFVLVRAGKAFYRSDAACLLFERLPLPWRLAGWMRILPRALRDPVYSLVARLRYRIFGRIEACGLLQAGEKSRFLSD